MSTKTLRWVVAGVLMLAACGGDGGGGGGGSEDATTIPSDEDEEVDNCTLLTGEEVSELAGYELVAHEDTALGCPFIPHDSDIADVRVLGVLAEGGAQAVAERGFPNAAEIIAVAVGDDTVAVTDPSGGAVASIVTASGNRVVELSVIFIDVPPDDPARIEEAARLAVIALERFGG